MRKLLTKLGYNARIVSDGLEAVDAYEAAPAEWDLILLDLNSAPHRSHAAVQRSRCLCSSWSGSASI